MKVHPAPRKRSNTDYSFGIGSVPAPEGTADSTATAAGPCSSASVFGTACCFTPPRNASPPPDDLPQKRLRRLPHVFSRVLELPLPAEADVDVRDDGDAFLFTAAVGPDCGTLPATVRARAIKVCAGVTKVVIRDGAEDDDEGDPDGGRIRDALLLDDLELDRWRFRLPEGTRLELASASYVDGDLVVSIPKAGGSSAGSEEERSGEEGEEDGDCAPGGGGTGRLVLVQ